MTTETVQLRTPAGAAGERAEFVLTLEHGAHHGPRFSRRYGTARRPGGGETDCLYKVASGEWGRRALSNEVAVFSGLGIVGVNTPLFAELLGDDLDTDEGGARLLQTRRGRALAGERRSSLPAAAQLWQPTHDLLSALQVLADNGYAHGAIAPDTVFWDGEGLQIADLSSATNQTGDGELLRDVRNAVGLLSWFASGEESSFGLHSEGIPRDDEFRFLTRSHPDLAMVLGPVYEGAAATAGELLARMAGWPRPAAVAPRPPAPPPPGGTTVKDAEKTETTETIERMENGTAVISPAPPVHDGDRQAGKNFDELWKMMHERPTDAGPLAGPAEPRPAVPRPRPEPGTVRPSLPKDFPFNVGDDGKRRPHPLLVWPALFILVLLILFMVM
ncbi:hypothetical protein [Actinomadura sp. 9N407]|uniref:hypothetical protein n=1 Tax=Actinomadura sp. 9N407 TaxID=3375154 RepID=UPI0037A215BA